MSYHSIPLPTITILGRKSCKEKPWREASSLAWLFVRETHNPAAKYLTMTQRRLLMCMIANLPGLDPRNSHAVNVHLRVLTTTSTFPLTPSAHVSEDFLCSQLYRDAYWETVLQLGLLDGSSSPGLEHQAQGFLEVAH